MKRNPKICFVSLQARGAFMPAERHKIGGAERQVQRLAAYLAARGNFDVRVIVEDEGQAAEEIVGGVRLVRLEQPARGRGALGNAWRNFRSARSLARTARALQADVYIQRSAGAETGIVARAAARAGGRFVYMMSSDGECRPPWSNGGGLRGRMFRRGLQAADRVIVQHERQRREVERIYGRAAIVLPSVYAFGPEPEGAGGKAVIWIGRCREVKRPLLFVELARRLPEARFVMVAPPGPREGELFERVRAAARETPNLELIAGAGEEELAAIYRRGAVLVNTSSHEGMPNTFLEGADHGLAIASLAADPGGMLGEAGTGFCAEGEMDRLAERVAGWIENESSRAASARHARQWLRERHDVEEVGIKFEGVIKEVVEAGTVASRKSIHVCIVLPNATSLFYPQIKAKYGGAEVQMSLLARGLARQPGFCVTLLLADKGQPAIDKIDGVILRAFRHQPGWRFKLDFQRALAATRADIHLQQSIGSTTKEVAFFCAWRQRKFIYWIGSDFDCAHGLAERMDGLRRGRWFVWALHRADRVIAQHEGQRALLWSNERLASEVIPNGFPKQPLDEECNRAHHLWVGHANPLKDPEALLDLAEHFPNEPFIMIMPAEGAKPELLHRIETRLINLPNVRRLDRVPFEQMPEYFNQARTLIITSRIEGFPNVMLQAFWSGAPVVSLHVDPGYLISRFGVMAGGSPVRLREEFGRLLSDPERQSQLRRGAYDYATSHLTSERMIGQFAALAKKLMEG